MAEPKYSHIFHDVAGKTVVSMRYAENADAQTLEIAFRDSTVFSFDFQASITVTAQGLTIHDGNLQLVRDYGRLSNLPE